MLKYARQNYHHSKLPDPGEIVYIAGLRGNSLNGKKCVVSHYRLFENWQWYGIDKLIPGRGIHCAYVRVLATGEIVRIAGQWLVSPDDFADYRYQLAAGRIGLYGIGGVAKLRRKSRQ